MYPKNSRNLVRPLFETYEALLRIQKGASPSPLITPKFGGGSRTTSPEGERVQGEAAAALELFIVAGEDPEPAARKVARRVRSFDLENRGYLRNRRGGITWKTVKGWRDRFQNSGDGGLGAMRFRNALRFVETFGLDAQDDANFALNTLLGSLLPENREKPPLTRDPCRSVHPCLAAKAEAQ